METNQRGRFCDFFRAVFSVLAGIVLAVVFYSNARCDDLPKKDDIVGEFSGLGIKVTAGNYYFAKGAIMVLGSSRGGTPQTDEKIVEQTWEDLLLSYEAFKRGITVTQEEFETELDKLLKSEKVTFDRKKDPKAYENWLKEKTGEPPELFENQIRHLMQIKKLRQQILDGIKPAVSQEEAYQEYLDEYNTLELELAQFDNQKDAQDFFRKTNKKPKVWEQEIKSNPKLFRRPGFVSFQFLADMWQIPKEDLSKMLKLDAGTIYPPRQIYGAKTAVFRIIKKRIADGKEFKENSKPYYLNVENRKKYEALDAWIKQLKNEAQIKVYPKVETLK